MAIRERVVSQAVGLSDSKLEQLFRQAQFGDALTYINSVDEHDLNDFQLSLKIDLLILNNDLPGADRLLASFGSVLPTHPHIFLALVRYHRAYQRPDGVCMVYSQFKDAKWDLEIPEHQFYHVQVSRFYLLALIDLGNYALAKQTFEQLADLEIVKNDPLLHNKLLATGVNLYRTLHDLPSYQECTQKVIKVFKKLGMIRELASPMLDQASILTLMGKREHSLEVLREVQSLLIEQPNDEMNPYVFETEAATRLYSGSPIEAHLLYTQAVKTADAQGAGGTYFSAPQNYTKFLQLRKDSPQIAYDWFVQESHLDVPATAVERTLMYGYLAVAAAQSGQFNRDFLELGLATEDFALYIRVLAYLAEGEFCQGVDENLHFNTLSSLKGISFKDILQYDLEHMPHVAKRLIKFHSLPEETDTKAFEFRLLDGLSLRNGDKTMKVASGLGGSVLAALLVTNRPISVSELTESLFLTESDQKSLKQSVNRLNDKLEKFHGNFKNAISSENNFFALNRRLSLTLDLDSSLVELSAIVEIEPDNILAGFSGQVFDDFREMTRETILRQLIHLISSDKVQNLETLQKILWRAMRSYKNDFDLLEALLPVCKKWRLNEVDWLESQLREVQ